MAKPPNQTEHYAPIHPKRERAVPPAKRKNFRLREVREVLEDAGYSPAEAMLRIAEQAELSSQDESYEISTRRAFAEMALKANMDLLQYVAPKLTRTEHTGENGGPIRVSSASELTDDELAAIAATGSR